MRMADGGVRVFVVPLRSIGNVGGERVPLLGSHPVSLTVCARGVTPAVTSVSEAGSRIPVSLEHETKGRWIMEMGRRNFLAAAAATAAAAANAALASPAGKIAPDRDWTGHTPVTHPQPAWDVRDKPFPR